MSMDTLPYELLQLIASCLLPKYQCRFALTSRHHYRYLYSYLLRWHAQKAPIETPKCAYFNGIITIRIRNNELVIYNSRTNIFSNITLMTQINARKCEPFDQVDQSTFCAYIITFNKLLRRNYTLLHKDIRTVIVKLGSQFYKTMIINKIFSHVTQYLGASDLLSLHMVMWH